MEMFRYRFSRDSFSILKVAKIETEKLLAQTVAAELEHLAKHGKYKGSFSPQFHSYGYEGRSCLPSPFDATYCYALVCFSLPAVLIICRVKMSLL
jgi:pyrophosphate--fructose-6-phosphate 1-phosphotransferase